MKVQINISCDEANGEEQLRFSGNTGARFSLQNLQQQNGYRRRMRQISEKSVDIHPLNKKTIVSSDTTS